MPNCLSKVIPCRFCGRMIDSRSRHQTCIHCFHSHKAFKTAKHRRGWQPKIRVVEFDRPRLWADLIASVKPQARAAEGYCSSALRQPAYDERVEIVLAPMGMAGMGGVV